MILPAINPVDSERDFLSAFGGYSANERCQENEAFNEMNMTSDLYPNMSPREPRIIFEDNVLNLKGLHVNNGLIEIKDSGGTSNALFYDGTYIATLSDLGERQMCSMGAYVIIWPDKKRFNTQTRALEDLCASFNYSGTVKFQLCKLDGTQINPTVSSTAPANPTAGQYWLDTSTTPNALKVWSESQGMWTSVATSYTKIIATGIGTNFEKMDVVKISGVTGTYADTFNTDMAIWDKTSDSIIVTALINNVFENTGITIKREPPDMDFICEHGNRLWGCSSEKHEIYGSKLGDPTNFYSYLGTAADSYAATVGTEGDFTGCAEQGGSVVFFKERHIHKLYGSWPSNYQISATPERGVQKGCHKSLKLINGLLIYKAVDGVCYYEGSYPRLISEALGNTRYENASAGVWKDKYYIRMSPVGETRSILFTYDTDRQLWHKEDETTATRYDYFTVYNNRLLLYDIINNRIVAEGKDAMPGIIYQTETSLPWFWESGIIGIDSPVRKFISQILIRMAMELYSEIWVDVMYDSSGEWEEKAHIKNNYEVSRRNTPGYTALRSVDLPIIPRRCDHMRLRIRGEGISKIFSISKIIEQGGII